MAVAGVVLAVLFASGGGGSVALGQRIAVLEIDGIIGDDRELLETLRTFRRDRSVRGFVISINSPGGVVAPSQSIYNALRELRETDDRPVIASIRGVGASGGYYVALGADSIFALPGSITGSIGVIMEFPDASELLSKVGVRVNTVESAEHKDVGSMFQPLSEADRALLDTLVQDVYRQFVDVVAAERKLSPAQLAGVADGRILSGRQALERGLIDRLGSTEDAIAAAGRMARLGEEPRTVRPPEEKFRLIDLLLGRASGTAEGVWRRLAGMERGGGASVRYQMPW
jgi:protease-4